MSIGPGKQIRVHRVVCVIDCGLPVNPNLIRQQMESGIVFGLSAALQDEITIVDGQVQQKNFVDFPVVRMNDCPGDRHRHHAESDCIRKASANRACRRRAGGGECGFCADWASACVRCR